MAGTFTLTGRFKRNDGTAFAASDFTIEATPFPDAGDATVYSGSWTVTTDVNGQFSISTLVTEPGLLYRVWSADGLIDPNPATFAAPSAGTTKDVSSLGAYDAASVSQSIADQAAAFAATAATSATASASSATASATSAASAATTVSTVSLPKIFIPATAFIVTAGSATASNVGSGVPVWTLDAAAAERIATSLTLPTYWATFAIDVWWTNAAAGTGDVRYRYEGQFIGAGDTLNVPPVVANVGTAAAQNVVVVTTVASTVTNVPAKRLVLGVLRDATNVADTLPNDADVIGVELRRLT